MLREGALKMAKIELMKRRQDRRAMAESHSRDSSWGYRDPETLNLPPSPLAPVHPGAVELPAEDSSNQRTPTSRHNRIPIPGNPPYPFEGTGQDKYPVGSGESNSSGRVSNNQLPYRFSGEDDKFTYQPPQNSAYNPSEPPPRPPKTPINDPAQIHPALRPSPGRTNGAPPQQRPPYPDYDDLPPPPLVSKLRKPEFIPRST